MKPHCTHPVGNRQICCWCPFSQNQVRLPMPDHGPYAPQAVHWEPPNTGPCPKRPPGKA